MNAEEGIGKVKGVGVKTEKLLNDLGIYKMLDLLLYFPRDYEFYEVLRSKEDLANNKLCIMEVYVEKIGMDIRGFKGKTISTIRFKGDNFIIYGKWFNQPYIKNNFSVDNKVILKGILKLYKGEWIITNPLVIKGELKDQNLISPVYPLKEGISNNMICKYVKEVLSKIIINENFPSGIIKENNLCSLDFAIRNIHCPESLHALESAKLRLKFQEIFTYILKLKIISSEVNNEEKGIKLSIAKDLKALKESIPYELTGAQNRVIREILIEQKNGVLMNRLVQGDVGSGKTIVAFITAFNAIRNGYQCVMMAPTEILAKQHYEAAMNLFHNFNIKIALLTGSIKTKEKEEIKEAIKKGDIDFVIGTHALLQEDVEFKNLSYVITDEQHRFGVMQRAKLMNKGSNVHMLIMTATPIPRTLSLYLYGDLKVSTINELPKGRQQVKTFCFSKNKRAEAYKFSLTELQKGRQIYVVCPLVEESEEISGYSVEELYKELKSKYYKDYNVGILHGKMKPQEKEEAMKLFKEGKINVLISTTVIEVGINVKNATVMIVENAERFGLSQLHQLRGRVCRGSFSAYCMLISHSSSEISKKRMDIITSSSDGFYISEEDLKLRGAGDMFGVMQSGASEFKLINILDDADIVKAAYECAGKIIEEKGSIYDALKIEIMKNLEESKEFICFN